MSNVTLGWVYITIVAMQKQLSMTYSACVSVALIIQHAKPMCGTVLLSVG